MTPSSEQVKLKTSDDPPVTLSVSRSALVAHAGVFADLLTSGLNSDGDDESVPLSEGEQELSALCAIVEGKVEEAEKILGAFDKDSWEKLATLADKYDCLLVRKYVETKAWQVEAEQGSAAFAFTLATLTGDAKLICATARRAALIPDLNSPALHVTQEWRDRLAAWRTVHLANCIDKIRTRLRQWVPVAICGHGKCQSTLTAARDRFSCLVWTHFDVIRPGALLVDKVCIPDPLICDMHYYTSHRKVAEELEALLAQWPEFPVTGLTFGSMKNSLRYK